MPKMKNLFNFKKSQNDLTGWSANDDKLVEAIEDDNIDKVEKILKKKNFSATKQNDKGQTPLHIAAIYGCVEAIQRMIAHNIDLCAPDSQGRSALHIAARHGKAEIVELLLKVKTGQWPVDDQQWTPLHHACLGGSRECVQVILKLQTPPDIHALDKDGKTPLFLAAQMGLTAICKELIDRGVKLNAVDKQARTALMYAAEHGNKDTCEFLVKKGAIAALQDSMGRKASWYAIDSGHSEIKYILDQAPSQASWDIDSGADQTHEGVLADDEHYEQVDYVATFTQSPTMGHREVLYQDGASPTHSARSVEETWHSSAEESDIDNTKVPVNAERPEVSLDDYKELEEEHEVLHDEYQQLNRDYQNLKRKLTEIESRAELEQTCVDETIIEDLNTEVKELQDKLSELTDDNKDLTQEVEELRSKLQDYKPPSEQSGSDSWGDSDDELFDLPGTEKTGTSLNLSACLIQKTDPSADLSASLSQKTGTSPFTNESTNLSQKSGMSPSTNESTNLSQKTGTSPSANESLSLSQNEGNKVVTLQEEIDKLKHENSQLIEQIQSQPSPTSCLSHVTTESDEEQVVPMFQYQEMKKAVEGECLQLKTQIQDLVMENLALSQKATEASFEDSGSFGDMSVEKLIRENDALKETIGQQVEEIKSLSGLCSKLEEVKEDNTLLKHEAEALKGEILLLKKESDYEEIKTENTALKSKLEKSNEEIESLKLICSHGGELEMKISSFQSEINDLKGTISILEKASHEKNKEHEKTLLKEKQSHDSHMTTLQSEIDHMSGEVDEHVKEIGHLKTICEEQQRGLLSSKEQYDECQLKCARLEGEVQRSQESQELLSANHTRLKTERDAYLHELETLREHFVDGEPKCNMELISMKSETSRLNSTLHELKIDVAHMSEEREELQRSVSAKESLICDVQNQLETLKDTMHKQAKTPSPHKDTQKVAALKKQIVRLQQQLAEQDHRHREVVETYRSHLLGAVQGDIDPDVKEALCHIIHLRSSDDYH